MTVFLIVVAKVPNEIKDDFDEWYEKSHLPEAHYNFKSIVAFRGWVNNDEHHAFYQFKDITTAKKVLKSVELQMMINKFDNKWIGKVIRSRELMKIIQKI